MDDWSFFPKWDTTNFSLTHYYLIHTIFNIRVGLKWAVTSYNYVVKKRYTLFNGKNISSLTQSSYRSVFTPHEACHAFLRGIVRACHLRHIPRPKID
jgi:hypothetical protein